MNVHSIIRWLSAIGLLLTVSAGRTSSSAQAQDYYGAAGVVQRQPAAPGVSPCGPAGCPASARPVANPWDVYPRGVSGDTSSSTPRGNGASNCSPGCLSGCGAGSGCGAAGCPNRSWTVTRWDPTFGTPGSMSSRVRQFFGASRPTYSIEPPRTQTPPRLLPKPADAFYTTSRNATQTRVSTNRSAKPLMNPDSPFYP